MDYYDKEGNPLELMEWAELFEDHEYKIIQQETVGEYWVSTVWVGLDMGHWSYGDVVPLIFETMIFDTAGEEVWCERHPTLEAAKHGHLFACTYAEHLLDDDDGDPSSII